MLEKRLSEAMKLGFTDFILPFSQKKQIQNSAEIKKDKAKFYFIKKLKWTLRNPNSTLTL